VANAMECQAMNPETIIADKEKGICRKPMVQSCQEYNWDGTDTCKKCNSLYYVGADGLCYGKAMWLVWIIVIELVMVLVVLAVWIWDLVHRPIKNLTTLKEALTFRSHQKQRSSKEDGRSVYPLTTNLLRETPAGPGMMLHFNFQFMIIIWASLICLGWVVLGAVVDPQLFIIGTRKFGTPFRNCVLVAWGYETQQALMWSKTFFLVCVYFLSFIGAFLHSVRQLRLFQACDYNNKTMKDFVVMLQGIPPVKGSELVEENLQTCIEQACGDRPVGVSVGWDFEDKSPLIMGLLEKDMVEVDKSYRSTARPGYIPRTEFPDTQEEQGVIRKHLLRLEDKMFRPAPPEESKEPVKETLENLVSSPDAFAVFTTEEARNACLERLKDQGFDYKGTTVSVVATDFEPGSVQWQFLGRTTVLSKCLRLLKGFGAILLALCFWTVIFYLPYAWSVFSFNYDNGQEPGVIYSIAFSMVVVVGNQIMYEVCARVAENVGFKFADRRAACYMILFTISCLYNVLVDMVTTYFMSEQIMMSLGFRTYAGEKLAEVNSFTERFEAYAMQRTLAENTFLYAWPSTFLVPFLLEPIFTIYVPLKLGVMIVRSHTAIQGRDAENLVASMPMDLGRYSDILLNVMLGILIFYFPGGYTHWLFLGMVGSHCYIYFMDHCRLLRTVPNMVLATMDVDWWSQFMLAPCCGLIASCTVFKSNCQGYGFCLEGGYLIAACTGAFAAHCAIHWFLLLKVVPLLGKTPPKEDPCAGVTFGDVAGRVPCSWFTSNPVHCLRSQHIYMHSPPCRYHTSGKEHLLQANTKIGCFFEDGEAAPEDYSAITGEKGWVFQAKVQGK